MNSWKTMLRRLLALALPIMGASFLQTLYNLADTFFLGRLGREAVSAPSIAFNIIMFLVVFGVGFAMAATTLISQAKGKGDQERINFYASQIFTLSIVLSVLIAAAGQVFTPTLLRLMQVPDDVFPYVQTYLRVIFFGMPFMFISFIFRGIMQGIGNSMVPFRIQLVTIVLNVVIDPIVIFGLGPFPALGVAGAAGATIFCRMLESAAAVYLLASGKKGVKIQRRMLKPDKDAVLLLARIGMPTAVGQGFSSLGFIVLQGVVNTLGAVVIAAFSIAGRIIMIFNMPAMGLGQAAAVLVGQSLGAKRPDQAKLVISISLVLIIIFMGIGMTLTFFYGQVLTGVFIDDPAVNAMGGELFRIVSFGVVFFSVFMVLNGAFQGGGDTKPIMVMNTLRLWGVRVPLAYVSVIILGFGASGIWWAMLISNFLSAGVYYMLYRSGRWIGRINPDEI